MCLGIVVQDIIVLSRFDERAAFSMEAKTLFADILAPVGDVNINRVDMLFEEEFGAMDMTHETLEHQPSQREIYLLDLLHRAVRLADFYYLYHVLRSILQSSDGLSAMMEKGSRTFARYDGLSRTSQLFTEVTLWLGLTSYQSQDMETESYKSTKIYQRFHTHERSFKFRSGEATRHRSNIFLCTGIMQYGDHPVGRGGFADVWTGSLSVQGMRDRMLH